MTTSTETRCHFRSLANYDDGEPYETFESLSCLLSAHAGCLYVTPHYVLSWSRMHTVWKAQREDNGEIIGVLLTQTLDPEDTWRWNHLLPPEQHISSDPPALYLADVCVMGDQSYRRQGVATEMIRGVIEYSTFGDGQPYSRVFALSRVPSSGKTSGTSYGLLTKGKGLDFSEVGRFPRWYAVSDRFQCPICDPVGDGDACSCEARLLQWTRPRNSKDIEGEKEE